MLAEDRTKARARRLPRAQREERMLDAGEQIGRWWLDHEELPKERVTEHFVNATGAAIGSVLGA